MLYPMSNTRFLICFYLLCDRAYGQNNCGQPTINDGTIATPYGTLAGATASFTCDTNFVLSGAAISTCSVSGWDPKPPKCNCPILNDILGGSVDAAAKSASTPVGGKATYTCIAPLLMTLDLTFTSRRIYGVGEKTCQTGVGWSPPEPYECGCATFTPLVDGWIGTNTLGVMYIGHSPPYRCNAGFVLKGARSPTCTVNGWNTTAPTCECPTLNNIPGGIVNEVVRTASTALNGVASYQCTAGMVLVGIANRTCLTGIGWNGTAPECHCSTLPAPNDGSVDKRFTTTSIGGTATYQCNYLFVLNGPQIRTCTATGWSGNAPTCECHPLGNYPGATVNGVVLIGSIPLNGVARFKCYPNLVMIGNPDRYCLTRTGWNGTEPECRCNVLPDLVNGHYTTCCGISPEHRNTTSQGGYATYQCNTGFVLNGLARRTCRDTGWDGNAPMCESTSPTLSPTQSTTLSSITTVKIEYTSPTTSTTQIHTLSSKSTVQIADTTHANTVSSDGNISTVAIIAISAGSGVALTLIIVAVSFTVFRSLRTRKPHNAVELDSPVYHTIAYTNPESSHSNLQEARVPGTDRQPDSHMYQYLEPRNGNANGVHGYENVF